MSLDELIGQRVEAAIERVLERHLAQFLAQQPNTKLAYSVPEVAEHCAMSEREVYEALRAGKLQGIRGAKGKWIVPHVHLMSFLLGQDPQHSNTAQPGVRQRAASGR